MDRRAAGEGGKSARGAGHSAGRTILEYGLLALTAIAIALLVQAFLVKPYRIPSESMENTLLKGDRVLADRISWRFSAPRRGEVVVFHEPGRGLVLIKRIIGMPGDTLSLRDGAVYVNGKRLAEPYVRRVDGRPGAHGALPDGPPLGAPAALHGAGGQLLHDGRQPH